MADIQIAVIDEKDTQIALAVPGIQGPAGAISSGGSANQVFYKVSGTNYDAGWTFIGNANVDAAAAIAGTKISPNFGSQAIVTTGTNTAASFIPTSSSIPSNGIYLPDANQVGVATNGTQRITVDADGRLLVGTASLISDNWTGNNESIQTAKSGLNSLSILAATAFTAAHSSYLALNRARGSLASPTIVANGDTLGAVYFSGYDGSSYLRSASIDCVAEGTIAATRIGSRLAFNTSTDAAPSVVTERMTITSGGLVGIGSSSPSANLEVKTTSDVGIALTNSSSVTSGNRGSISMLNSANSSVGTIRFAAVTDNVGTEIQFYTRPAAGSLTQTMTLDSAGRLGIGTTGPSSRLSIAGTTNTVDSQIIITATSVASAYLGVNADGLNLGTDTAGIVFKTGVPGGTSIGLATGEKARIDSSGRLLVGTSTYQGDYTLQIQGDATSANAAGCIYLRRGLNTAAIGGNVGADLGDIQFGANDGTVAARIECFSDATWSSTSDTPGRLVFSSTPSGSASPVERMRLGNSGNAEFFVSNEALTVRASGGSTSTNNALSITSGATGTTDGTLRFVVETRGNVFNQNNAYGSLSDVKLKENIVDASSQWSDLKNLKVRKYNFKEIPGHTQIGLVAQEAELVSPGLVSESPDRDEEGNDLGTVTKSVSYSVLYMKAVKALQEAMERIEQLESKVAALEGA